MRLIDADRLYNTIIDEIDPISISMDGGEMRGMMRTIIAAEPTIDAVPIKAISEWLAEHYGSPCQLAEIDCYPQCEPDENGECYGMRTDDKKCWHDYLTKWMEGLDADRP